MSDPDSRSPAFAFLPPTQSYQDLPFEVSINSLKVFRGDIWGAPSPHQLRPQYRFGIPPFTPSVWALRCFPFAFPSAQAAGVVGSPSAPKRYGFDDPKRVGSETRTFRLSSRAGTFGTGVSGSLNLCWFVIGTPGGSLHLWVLFVVGRPRSPRCAGSIRRIRGPRSAVRDPPARTASMQASVVMFTWRGSSIQAPTG